MIAPMLPSSLPPLAKIFATAYDKTTGGYIVPPQHLFRHFTEADVSAWHMEWADKPQYDSVELEVATFIYSLIRMTGARSIFETGCSRGFSTSFLAAGVADNGGGRVISVDVEEHFHLWEGSEVAPLINFIKYGSIEVVDALVNSVEDLQFDLLFLDSLHTYSHLMMEIMLYERFLKVGGSIVLHDTIFYDCLGPVAEELVRNPRFETITLTTPRTHGKNSRSPGVTIVTKISDDSDTYPLLISQQYLGWKRAVLTGGEYQGRDVVSKSILDILREKRFVTERP